MVPLLAEHRQFLWDRLYMSTSVRRQMSCGKRIVTALFRRYLKRPPAKVSALKRKTGSTIEEAVKDYIAGMTDGFAAAAYGRTMGSRVGGKTAASRH
jgi:dGTP triphosphohydrolase